LRNYDLTSIDKLFREKYDTKFKIIPWDHERSFSLPRDLNDQLQVKADTLQVYINPYRAIMFQRDEGTLTSRDDELIEVIMKLFTRDRPSPFHFR
jgi:hypothetical protein